MLDGILKVQAFCERHSTSYPILKLTDDEWACITDLAEALTPARITTVTLQKEQLTLRDFYAAWLNCKLKTQTIGTDFAETLVDSLNQREKSLLSSDVFVAAIALDPR